MKIYGGKRNPSEHEPQSVTDQTVKIPKSVRKRKMPTSTKLLIAIIALIVTIALLVGVYFALYVSSPSQRPERTSTAAPATTASTAVTKSTTAAAKTTAATTTATTVPEPDPEQEVLDMAQEIDVSGADYKEGFFTMVVAGTDKDGIRTDTIIVATFDTKNKTVAMLNVPRDTLSKAKSGGTHKINAAYNNGIERTKVELKNLLGFAIDKYVILDFDAFEEIIDAIGGVEIDVPVNMYYNDPDQDLHINLKKGLQTLDGANALKYMRYRGYANADIARIEAQQKFYKALAKKMATPSTLLKLPALADVVMNNVETDLTLGEIIWLGATYITIDTSTIVTETLPHSAKYINGLSYVLPSKSAILKLVNEKFNPYTSDITQLNLAPVPVSTTAATTAAPDVPDMPADPNAPVDPSDPNGGIVVGDPIVGGVTNVDENGNVVADPTPSVPGTNVDGGTNPAPSTPATTTADPYAGMPEWLRPQN